jgi:CDP-glucose 4,6-dehydratase
VIRTAGGRRYTNLIKTYFRRKSSLISILDAYKGKKVFLTGHTGFKGSWLTEILLLAGATVTGYSTAPPTDPSLFDILELSGRMHSIEGDVRDLRHLKEAVLSAEPEIVIHLAAQPLVRESYKDPVYTYETNVLGTVNILEAVRHCESVRSFLNVTTDKVYENREWPWGYREDDPLDGYDPYSNSKSCSELVTHSYRKSFFAGRRPAVSTARAGNVIGGGDFAADRIIPDCIRAASSGEKIIVRNPFSTRPYQHVLEPLSAYLLIAERQYGEPEKEGYYNVGPEDKDCVTTGELADIFCAAWGEGMHWINKSDGGPHEANFLKLDCSKIRAELSWRPVWGVREAVGKTALFAKALRAGRDAFEVMREQIDEYFA